MTLGFGVCAGSGGAASFLTLEDSQKSGKNGLGEGQMEASGKSVLRTRTMGVGDSGSGSETLGILISRLYLG